ncbi:MAG TPA: knotted carbamoyltransferase YgeW [bacterium]|nr:knotted carbamoyltransferase YgeW [bacterium]HPQ19166.1 knotted carbamoyltransferase YgeW [bacterium]
MEIRNIEYDIAKLEKLNFNLYGQDFLLTYEKSFDDIQAVLKLAEILRTFYRNNISTRVFQTGIAIAQFRDKSTRTRFSFASATNFLGLALQEFDETKSQVSHGETIRETSNMISFLSEVIGIRDDMFIGKGHTYMLEVAAALDEGFREGVLPNRTSIINLQCDIDHPTQTLADLLHIKNKFFDLRGKKIAVSWAYSPSYGKPLSVPQGLITLLSRFGMNISLAYPEGYDLLPETVKIAKEFTEKSGGTFEIVHSMEEAFKNADIVYPKSWAPFEVMKKRTQLYEKNDTKGIEELEKEALANNAKFKDWECNERMMKLTKKGEALYMHCLPADISGVSCKEGEVSAEVFEKYRIQTYFEARYKPYIIAAMIILTRFRDPISLVDYLWRNKSRRTGIFR